MRIIIRVIFSFSIDVLYNAREQNKKEIKTRLEDRKNWLRKRKLECNIKRIRQISLTIIYKMI